MTRINFIEVCGIVKVENVGNIQTTCLPFSKFEHAMQGTPRYQNRKLKKLRITNSCVLDVS